MLQMIAVFNVFTCAFVRGYPEHLIKGHGPLGQLYQGLNTTDAIWMLHRSYTRQGHQCVYSVKESLKADKYEFNQYYYDSQGIHKQHLSAHLSMALTEPQGAQMTVRSTKYEGPGVPYVLLHWDDKTHCAILYFQDTQPDGKKRPECEAHIWDRNVVTGADACLAFYKEFCDVYKHDEQTVYNSNCKVHPGC